MHASETVIETFHAELRKGVQKLPTFGRYFARKSYITYC